MDYNQAVNWYRWMEETKKEWEEREAWWEAHYPITGGV
jgi:hypothetical protein